MDDERRWNIRTAPPRPAAPKPKPSPPVFPQGMLDEFEDKPYGSSGEWIVPRPHSPQAPPVPVWQPPPPDWEQERLERLAREGEQQPEPGPRAGALAELKEAGEGWPEMNLEPPAMVTPLLRPPIPEPDWREEERLRAELERAERERVARERRAEVLRELLAEDTEVRPAKRGKP